MIHLWVGATLIYFEPGIYFDAILERFESGTGITGQATACERLFGDVL